jgi:hypothetical protein
MGASPDLLSEGFILIQARAGDDPARLVELVTQIPGVYSARRVYGPYDVIAEVRSKEEGARGPAEEAIRGLDGVLRAIPLGVEGRVVVSNASEVEAA